MNSTLKCTMKVKTSLMTQFILGLLMSLFLWSCQPNKTISGVDIIPLSARDLSIRAVAVVDTNEIWFAANKGTVGVYNGKEISEIVLHYKDSLLHFRAIAHNGTHAFALTIDNPALLYQLTYDGNQISSARLVYREEGPGVFYDAIGFWNEKEGIAVGDPINGCLSVIITRDGGNHWVKMDCEFLPPVESGEALFAASNGSLALKNGQTYVATGGSKARVFKSSDKGETWTVFNTPLAQGSPMSGIFSIDQYDRDQLVIYGGDWADQDNNTNNKAFSRDGGLTWDLMSPNAGPGYRSSVRFIPGTQEKGLIAAGSKGIAVSHNSGDNWHQISDVSIYTLRFVNDSVAYGGGPGKFVRLNFF